MLVPVSVYYNIKLVYKNDIKKKIIQSFTFKMSTSKKLYNEEDIDAG